MSWKKYFTRARRDADFEEELEAYLAHETDSLRDAGLSADAARQAALRKLGNRTALRETVHEASSLAWLESAGKDVRYAVRQIRLSPGFAAVAILSLAFGAGVNTAIFQLLDAVRLRSLPVPDPGRVARIFIPKPRTRTGDFTGWPPDFTNAQFEQVRARQQGFSGVAAWSMDRINLSRSGEARLAHGMWVSGNFFSVLGVEPILGRTFTAADDNRECSAGVVISHAFWQREFGGDPAVLARTITVNTAPFPILGVAPPEFYGLDAGTRFDVALPLCAERIADGGANRIDSGIEYWLGIAGRLRPGWTFDKARAQLAAIAPQVYATTLPAKYDAKEIRNYYALRITAEPDANGQSELARSYETPLWFLLGASALVLLIACANLASIALARANAREREFSVRLAIGASRGRIVRQLLSESLVLSIAGCGAGLALAAALSRVFTRLIGGEVFLDLALDWRMALFTAGITAGACLVFGLAPAVRAARMSRSLARSAGGRITGESREGMGARRALAVAQIALSLLLVTMAVLCVGGLRQLLTRDPGFRADGVAVVMADISGAKMPAAQRAGYYLRFLKRIQAAPVVAAAASSAVVPMGGGTWNTPVSAGGESSTITGESYMNEVTAGYFAAAGTRLLSGRDFNGTDDIVSHKVAIVDRTFADMYFHGANPVGKRFQRTGLTAAEFEIVGLVDNSKYASLAEDRHATAYIDAAQDPDWDTETAFLVRANGPMGSAIDAVKLAARDMDPRPILRIETLRQRVADSLRLQQLLAALSGLYGVLAALLAAIGVYGALSYSVVRRKNEIGVRMALGASRGAVIGMILRESSALAIIGVAIGAALTVVATRAAASVIFGANTMGGPALIAAALGLAALAVVASFVPARRAAGIDSAEALRRE